MIRICKEDVYIHESNCRQPRHLHIKPAAVKHRGYSHDGSNAVIVVALEIIANGDVWNLIYDGKDINAPFKITSDGPTFNPNDWNTPDFNYPGREEDLVIAEIISINHSSKEDVNTVGTN